MEWLERLINWWELARESRARRRANSVPSFQWLLVRAGYPDFARSPMLACHELRAWFREEYPRSQIVMIDEEKHVLFYD